jgi:putative ABC transport system permease protein
MKMKRKSLLRLWFDSLGENVRFAMIALLANKLRAFLTIVGIVIGVTTVIAMVSLITGFSNNVTASFESFGATLVQFQKFDPQFGPGSRDETQRNRKELTYEDAQALKRLCPSMAAVSAERYWFGGDGENQQPLPTIKYESREADPDTFAGVTADYPAANNKAVGEGRFISESSSATTSPTPSFPSAIQSGNRCCSRE